jgi:NADH-quinone oxidoreductase subunit A
MPTAIVAYLTLFIMVGFIFLFVALLLGRLFRPISPSAEKSEAYECGEPPVGPGFVQFDLRFYVVALLFIVFEVELAFFFPPAVVFGKLIAILGHTAGQSAPAAKTAQPSVENEPSRAVAKKYQELGIHRLTPAPVAELESQARILAAAAMIDMGLFFIVLLVGFAYLWKRGDLDWVRAVKGFGGQGSGFRTLSDNYSPNPDFQNPNPEPLNPKPRTLNPEP